jgi:LemA protein
MTQQGWILLGSTIGTLLLVIIIFNTLIGRKNRVHQAFSTIDVMLKKRFDLIPNLLATANKYMRYEREILDRLTSLRAKASSSSEITDNQRLQTENQISQVLRSLFAVAENYPSLRANENFLQVQGSLNEIEEQISAARRAYNAAVTDFNNGVEMFPLSVMARMMGYSTRIWLETPDEERQPVKIQ